MPRSIIGYPRATTEQVCRSVVEIRAVTQTFTAKLTWLFNWSKQNVILFGNMLNHRWKM
jgi:hypothetical protein